MSIETTAIEAWHFVGSTLRDGSPIPDDGVWLEHVGEIELCASGFHASESIRDALDYAPGSTICRVELGGEVERGEDKLVASRRRILWRMDGETLLFEASRRFASRCLSEWDAPQVVRDWLETGDPKLRSAAESAARLAAGSAAESAAWSAAWSAAESAAEAAAWSSWSAWSAARSAARLAAWSAAWSAAESAAWSAARSAAEAAAEAAAWGEQERILLELIEEKRRKEGEGL